MLKHIDWDTVIRSRRSVRSFEPHPVEDEKLRLIKAFAQSMQLPFSHNVKVRLFAAHTDRKLYSVMASPPCGIAFLAETDACSISAAGFVGEIVILYAENLGLATCWYGHYLLEELERVMPHLGENAGKPAPRWGYGAGVVPGERAICITPLGYWRTAGLRLADRITGSLISHKRKPIGDLLDGGEENLPDEMKYALGLASLAPSAANSQHWRFVVSGDCSTITIAMPVGYRHLKWEHPDVDIGICASHFWLGLQMKGISARVSLLEEQGRAVWRFEL